MDNLKCDTASLFLFNSLMELNSVMRIVLLFLVSITLMKLSVIGTLIYARSVVLTIMPAISFAGKLCACQSGAFQDSKGVICRPLTYPYE